MVKDIHKGGRPTIARSKAFYEALLKDYETMTTAQLGKMHGVTRQTISRWLKTAREEVSDGNKQ